MATQQQSGIDRGVIAIWAIVAVLIIIVAAVVIKAVSNNQKAGTPPAAEIAPASLVAKLANVPTSTFETIGVGTSQGAPNVISAPALTSAGKPEVLYIGADYCPYCAAERWSLVTALSRFGSFSNLGLTTSSSGDVYPSTATFSFHGATYTSQYLSFVGVETSTNQVVGSGYAPLDSLTSDEQTILSTYDASPYLPSSAAGGIPFIDFGGKYLISGATYTPEILQGKTANQIASALSNTSDPITQGVIGAANGITAGLCTLTNNLPTTVCTTSIQALQAQLKPASTTSN